MSCYLLDFAASKTQNLQTNSFEPWSEFDPSFSAFSDLMSIISLLVYLSRQLTISSSDSYLRYYSECLRRLF